MLVVRWIVVLVALAAVVTALVLGVRAVAGALSGDDSTDAPAPAGSTSEDAAEPTTDPAAAPAECAAPDLSVQVAADAPAYTLGQTATFTLTITNGGAAPCTVDAGRTATQLVITSGTDRIWSSADCEPGDPRLLLLDTGGTDVSTIAWATDRSAPECPADLPAIGAGTYQAVVTTATTSTEPLVFTVG